MARIFIFSFVALLCINNPIRGDILEDQLPKVAPAIFNKATQKETCKCVPSTLCTNDKGEGEIVDYKVPCQKDQEVCCLEKNLRRKRQISINRPAGCGYRNTQGIGPRRPGAQPGDTNFGEIPWMVAVFKIEIQTGTNLETDIYVCGGSLVHPKAVLSAAHCVLGLNSGKRFKIRAGEWDNQNTNEMYPHQDREVTLINTPTNYRAGTLYNDIAVLILNEAIQLSPHIDVICLPAPQQTVTNGDCFVSGWGKNKAGIQSNILKSVQQPIVDTKKCEDLLRSTKLGGEFQLHYNFICAGGVSGQDVCGGFGGSPLVCPIPGQQGRYSQVGLVSWGIGCGDHIPSVYINIAEFRNWIDEQMQYQRLNESSYKYL